VVVWLGCRRGGIRLELVAGQGGVLRFAFWVGLLAAFECNARSRGDGVAGGVASASNWELNFKHQVHVIGLHIGVLGQQAPGMFAELMGELARLIEIGVYPPGEPTVYDLADGPKALAELEARATVGKIALKP